ncbi:MAG TPA: SDR family oxidoreductase [Candidatus Angelobacter sp.]|nr:SDR family oxidoreductase [Candidatus Angelobacter sp.]
MQKELDGQVAVVTGGSKGIGAAIARELARLGASTIICGRKQSGLDGTAASIRAADGRCEAHVCDVADWNSVIALAAYVEKSHGRLHILVNNAGVASFGKPLHQTAPETWTNIIDTNLRGVFHTVRAFVPLLLNAGGGHIINISSIASKNPLPNGAAYAASKWGLNGLSYSVAEELRSQNIRVAIVCPGSTHTELSPHEGKSVDKMLRPEDVARVVAMLVQQSPNSFTSEVILRPTQKP